MQLQIPASTPRLSVSPIPGKRKKFHLQPSLSKRKKLGHEDQDTREQPDEVSREIQEETSSPQPADTSPEPEPDDVAPPPPSKARFLERIQIFRDWLAKHFRKPAISSSSIAKEKSFLMKADTDASTSWHATLPSPPPAPATSM